MQVVAATVWEAVSAAGGAAVVEAFGTAGSAQEPAEGLSRTAELLAVSDAGLLVGPPWPVGE